MDKEKYKKFLELKKKLQEDAKNKPKEEPKWPYELFGIECGDGWKKLYEPILRYIENYNKNTEYNPIIVRQIKEKFGSLRIYLSHYTNELREMIDKAEDESEYVCETCGKHIDNPIVENHWIYAECDDCHNKFLDKQTEEIKKYEEKVKTHENNKGESKEGRKTTDKTDG